jgi:hypothetical protein
MVRRRGFGEVERRSGPTGVVYRARYTMPDGTRYSRTVGTKLDAEAWLMHERTLIDQDAWTPPALRKVAEQRRQAQASFNTVGRYAEHYLRERQLRPNTLHGYRALLDGRILPYFGEMPLSEVTLSEIKNWRASLPESTLSSNAAAYRLLRSMLVAAEEEELIDRAPPKIRGASTARVQRIAVPATLDEIDVITDAMPDHLELLVVLAAFVGLRQASSSSCAAPTSTASPGGSASAARSTRRPSPQPPAHASSAVDRSARPRPPAAPASSTSRRRSCRCSSGT